jgi:apolipoprotein N-acyltransferase
LPVGATFDTTTGQFSWTPTSFQAGTYLVRFTVADGEQTDFEEVTVTVLDTIADLDGDGVPDAVDNCPTVPNLTAWTGAYGLSFLVIMVNVAFVDTLAAFRDSRARVATAAPSALARAAMPALVTTLVVACSTLYGFVVMSAEEAAERVMVAAVHGDIPQSMKWAGAQRSAIIARHVELTLEVASRAPVVVIWPEAAVPGDLASDPQVAHLIARLARQTGSYLLVGSSERAKFSNAQLAGRFYNTLVLITPQGRVADEYRKVRLVPFGEYEPLKGVVHWPRALVPVSGAMVAGDRQTLFRVGPTSFGAAICWESLFPELFRAFVRRGARFMVSATNEAWFDGTGAAEQFLAITVFRAAENRTPIVRSSNLGVSALIDPFGRITRRLPNSAGAGRDGGGSAHGNRAAQRDGDVLHAVRRRLRVHRPGRLCFAGLRPGIGRLAAAADPAMDWRSRYKVPSRGLTQDLQSRHVRLLPPNARAGAGPESPGPETGARGGLVVVRARPIGAPESSAIPQPRRRSRRHHRHRHGVGAALARPPVRRVSPERADGGREHRPVRLDRRPGRS